MFDKIKAIHLWIATAAVFILTGVLGSVPIVSDILAGLFVILLVVSIIKTRKDFNTKKMLKEHQKDKEQVGEITEPEYFHLRGINYTNRQETIKNLKEGSLLTSRLYRHEHEPAIELLYEGQSVGVVPKELARRYTILLPDFYVQRVYEFDDGRFGAEIQAK